MCSSFLDRILFILVWDLSPLYKQVTQTVIQNAWSSMQEKNQLPPILGYHLSLSSFIQLAEAGLEPDFTLLGGETF